MIVRRRGGRGIVALALLSLAGGAAEATDTLPRLPVVRDITSEAGTVIRVRRSTEKSPLDIAGYKVRGALGYAFGDGPFRYAPAIIRARGGERLKFTFLNELDGPPANFQPPADAGGPNAPVKQNIHTHGLVTSPCTQNGFFGDNVFLTIRSDRVRDDATGAHHHHAATDATDPVIAARATSEGCGERQVRTVTGKARYEIEVKKDGASGLYWYHPHIHGVAEVHVSAGLSGVLLVGSLCHGGHLTPNEQARLCKDGQPVIPERVMMLKDAQLTDIDESRWTATLRKPYSVFQCGTQTEPIDYDAYRGECAIPSVQGGERSDKWIFTINGAQYPNIVVGAGNQEIWRLANVGSAVTYNLALIDSAGKEVPFDVINIDGYYLPKAVKRHALTMMPGTRADIVVTSGRVNADGRIVPFRNDRRLRLVQRRVVSGGPVFPAIALASVVMKGTDKPKPTSVAHIGLDAQTAAENAIPDSVPVAGRVHTRPAECRNKRGLAQPTVVFRDGTVIPPNKDRGRSDGKTPVIPLSFGTSPDFSLFFINTNGQGSGGFDMSQINLCIEKGATLKFLVNNESVEAHNLHIHQTRFVVEKLEYERGGRMNRPNVPLDHFFDAVKVGGKEVPVQRDTAPVPVNGTVQVKVTFPEAGRFVYHCHILAHEDLGMMQIAEVFESKD